MKEKVSQISINESWQKNLATLINHQRLRSFPLALEDFLATLCAFDTFLMVTYKKSFKPIILSPAAPAEQSKTLQIYVNHSYVLDPLFNAIQNGISSGVTRLAEIMPDSFESTEYYQSCYQDFGLVDEIDLIVYLDNNVTCAVTLGRKDSLGAITRAELNSLNDIFPVINALIRQFWLSQASEYIQYEKSDGPMKQALNSFASGVLTQREREITGLILRGHSSKAIADMLNISVGTVKVHRKNIHTRLNTSTHSEIFTLFLAHLSELESTQVS
ncbi:LuxR C-terminal-related transcriptional regulator [Motiliproteus sp. MSK22-1]|uniref:helix-turn-helix transcriptional regulator n=1 Tax=Motiliproteus sp. MSK22-1 TaxID=1897630 RepID=UPI0009774DC5|nr:LuxR C-terminal-related transcriptional regulator [Motiliproteus sp. MSK22-1]OMH38893.1 helix-turn-helix transcriptional regulator [Motiliproteus sp. MSK22-1]